MTPTSRGVVAGRVLEVRRHPNADKIRIAIVDINAGRPLQIVFGGPPIVTPGCIVPVAPPGSRIGPAGKKMRRRNYRGQFSEGMLCSLQELGWVVKGRDEVAILKDVAPGASIDEFGSGAWLAHVKDGSADAAPTPVRPFSPPPLTRSFRWPATISLEEARGLKMRVPTLAKGVSLVRDA